MVVVLCNQSDQSRHHGSCRSSSFVGTDSCWSHRSNRDWPFVLVPIVHIYVEMLNVPLRIRLLIDPSKNETRLLNSVAVRVGNPFLLVAIAAAGHSWPSQHLECDRHS